MKTFLLLSLLALPVLAQDSWTTTTRYAVFATYATETGPPNVENKFFSTNWFEAGVRHTIGDRGLVIFRGRASLVSSGSTRCSTPVTGFRSRSESRAARTFSVRLGSARA